MTDPNRRAGLRPHLWLLSIALLLGGVLPPVAAQRLVAQEDDEPAEKEIGKNDAVIYPITGELTRRYCGRITRELEHLIEKSGYQNIILKIDTPGGDLAASRELAKYIDGLRRRDVFTVAYVPSAGDAFSAGTLIAFACEKLEMGENARLGNVAPMGGFNQELGEKYQTVVRADLLQYAKKHGIPEALVVAMVTKEKEVYRVKVRSETGSEVTEFVLKEDLDPTGADYTRKPERVVSRGDILTINEARAVEYGFIDRVFPTEEQLLQHYKFFAAVDSLDDLKVGNRIFSATDNMFVKILNHPLVQFLLIVLGVLGLVLEMKIPGFGIPGISGVLAFTLFFVGAAMGGSATWFEASLFVISLILLGVEVFVIPGFGIAGVSGLILLVTSLVLAIHEPGLTAEGTTAWSAVMNDIAVVVLGLGAAVVALMVALHYLPEKGPGGSGLVSTATLGQGFVPQDVDQYGYPTDSPLMNRVGKTASDLRPAGKMELDGELLDVVAGGEFVRAGTEVEIILVEGNRIVVRPV